MDQSAAVRRFVHCLVALAPLYYLLPAEVPGIPIRRWHLLIAFFAAILLFEAVRLRKGFTFLGLRPHERNSIASFAWAASGITVALWLLPMEIATPVLVGMGFVDPLAGELRRLDKALSVQAFLPLLAYLLICIAALLAMTEEGLGPVLIVSCMGAIVAVGVERLDLPIVDDDFMMVIVPGSLMTALWLVI
ncbi:MAG: hypothetical protein JSV94_06815 [Methanobacteriota archaeon]|nr:MAG: hypothetical protein JSV94_06815 [Euryarchaeota archaeon]